MVGHLSKGKSFLKSLIFTGNWNYENMQGSGFRYLLEEIDRANDLDIDHKQLSRQTEYFNTHPFLVNFVLGVWFKEFIREGQPDYFKKVYSSALAALGDSFFWHSLRPISFIIAALFGLINPVLGVIVYLLIFNLFHFVFLYIGFDMGYVLGKEVISWFNRIKFNKWAGYSDFITSFLLGILLSTGLKEYGLETITYYFFATCFLVVGFFIAKKLDVLFSLIIAIIACLIMLLVKGG